MFELDARSALLQGVGHLELQLGTFVERRTDNVFEGLAVDKSAGTIDDGGVAFGFDEADRFTCLALQIPVDERNLAAPLPAAYGFVGYDILSPAKEHGGNQDILAHATEEQHEQSHSYLSMK